MKKLIGFTGYARSGKDTAAGFLCSELGYSRVAFADALREMALAVDCYVDMRPDFAVGEPKPRRLSELVDELGWESAKKFPDVRRLLQRLGTEAGREILGDTVWIDLAVGKAAKITGPVVVSDVRFPNEVDAIHANGGIVVRVERPGCEPALGHVSDAGQGELDVDVTITNDSTLEKFREQVLLVESYYTETHKRSQVAILSRRVNS